MAALGASELLVDRRRLEDSQHIINGLLYTLRQYRSSSDPEYKILFGKFNGKEFDLFNYMTPADIESYALSFINRCQISRQTLLKLGELFKQLFNIHYLKSTDAADAVDATPTAPDATAVDTAKIFTESPEYIKLLEEFKYNCKILDIRCGYFNQIILPYCMEILKTKKPFNKRRRYQFEQTGDITFLYDCTIIEDPLVDISSIKSEHIEQARKLLREIVIVCFYFDSCVFDKQVKQLQIVKNYRKNPLLINFLQDLYIGEQLINPGYSRFTMDKMFTCEFKLWYTVLHTIATILLNNPDKDKWKSIVLNSIDLEYYTGWTSKFDIEQIIKDIFSLAEEYSKQIMPKCKCTKLMNYTNDCSGKYVVGWFCDKPDCKITPGLKANKLTQSKEACRFSCYECAYDICGDCVRFEDLPRLSTIYSTLPQLISDICKEYSTKNKEYEETQLMLLHDKPPPPLVQICCSRQDDYDDEYDEYDE